MKPGRLPSFAALFAALLLAVPALGAEVTATPEQGSGVSETGDGLTSSSVAAIPVGTVLINNGARATRSSTVRLSLTAVNSGGGAIQMCISNGATCSAWTAFAATKSWKLAAGSGVRTVRVWFRDQAGNTSAVPRRDTIIVDTTAPINGTVLASPGDQRLTLTWSGFADSGGSGVTRYLARFQEGSAPSSCSAGAPVPGYNGTGTTLEHTNLANDTVYGYRICARDAAGNTSSGATRLGKPVKPPVDTTPPTGTVTINGGGAVTNSPAVALTLTAADNGGGAIQMCISNTAGCSAWEAFQGTRSWTLGADDGTATVNVWFRDLPGNTTPAPSSDTILVDTASPRDGTVSLTRGVSGQLTLNWAGFTDPGGGVTGYLARYQVNGAPASCSAGLPVPGYAGAATTLVHSSLANGTVYGYRICAVDAAGNTSLGSTASGRAVPEVAPPTGTVTINGGDDVTQSPATTLTLTAADGGGGPIQMCISNTLTCGSWMDFAQTVDWTLAVGSGTANVNVWFRDQWENTSATPSSDTIVVDAVSPVDGTVRVAEDVPLQIRLTWSDFSDPDSGIAGYLVVFDIDSAPPSCAAGAPVPGHDGVSTAVEHTGLTSGTTYGYRVCAVDAAGNVSAGATASGQATLATCEQCHSVDRDTALAPNVMGDGTSATGTTLPYDDGSWGYNVNGHGVKRFDPDGAGPQQTRAVACADCHELGRPSPSTHLNDILETLGYPGSPFGGPNTNTSHLVSSYFGSISTERSWQLNFDNNCYQNVYCHKSPPTRGHRHESTHKDGEVRFGAHSSTTNPKQTRTQPYWTPWTINDVSTDAPPPTYHYAPCVACHDPHGMDDSAYTPDGCKPPIADGNFHMVRENFCNAEYFCNSNCHR